MKKEGKPIVPARERLDSAIRAHTYKGLDFSDTAIAFSDKSDEELKKMNWLFRMMNRKWLVSLGGKIGIPAVRYGFPFARRVVMNTVYPQFCGGRTLLDSLKSVDRLANRKVLTILDYGVEGKETEEDFNRTMNEIIRAIDFAMGQPSIQVVSSKITGLARFALLEKINRNDNLTDSDQHEFENVIKRVDTICHVAGQKGACVYFDAEESWIQDAIDGIVDRMMKRYNTEKAVVFNTFQLYRHDRLSFLNDSYHKAVKEGYILGAKLVRGAYMDKERKRAAEMGYSDPIQPNKEATDHDYNMAIRFCLDHFERVALSNATHNLDSNLLMARLIDEKGLPKDHPNLMFCQLYGMSDILTFNLANAGYRVAKYVPYGDVKDVIPYLIRRAQENASVTGDMSRELALIHQEMKRRGLR